MEDQSRSAATLVHAIADAVRCETSARQAAANATTAEREAARLQVSLLAELRSVGMPLTKATHVVSMALGYPLDGQGRRRMAARLSKRLQRGRRGHPKIKEDAGATLKAGPMSVTREQLYEAVWSGPMITVAKRLHVSGSFLARVCSQLNVPHPPRGYWAKLKAGKAPPRPPLPSPEPGDELEWNRAAYGLPRRHLPVPAPPASPPMAPPKSALPVRHGLIRDARPLFEKTRKSTFGEFTEYLRPYRQSLPDIVVTGQQLARALVVANALYLAFERRGFRVVQRGDFASFHRSDPDLRKDRKPTGYGDRLWSPHPPTLSFVGTVAIGLTIYEMAEHVEVKHVGDEWVRVADLPPPSPWS